MIYYMNIETDENGVKWLIINGSTGYNLNKWKIYEAILDYNTPESEQDRLIAQYQAWGYYD